MNYFDIQTKRLAVCIQIGLWHWQKTQRNLTLTDVRTVAKGLRKQGVPVELAVKQICTRGIA